MIGLPGSQFVVASSINAAGAITGTYSLTRQAFDYHGFVRSPEGNYTSFDVPGSRSTYGLSINVVGMIAGAYLDANQVGHGFVRSPWGSFTLFDFPGPIVSSLSMNAYGEIAGTSGGGFVRTRQGTVTPFVVPGSNATYALGIDLSGDIAGYYADATGGKHGFIRSPDGTITSFDVPGSIFTFATAMNEQGVIAGYYQYRTSAGTIGTSAFLRVP